MATGLLQDMQGVLRMTQLENHGLDLLFGPVYGETRWVQNGHGRESDGGNQTGLDKEKPFETLQAAIAASDKWDRIIVGAGHTETITTDDHWDWQAVGTQVIGLGFGAERPTFTVSTLAAASAILDQASTVLSNLLFISGIDDLTDPLVVDAADCLLHNIEWRDASGMETVDVVWLKSGATRCLVDGLKIKGNSGGNSGQSALHLDGCDDCTIKNFDLKGDYQTGVIENVGDEALNIRILGAVDNPWIGGWASRIWTQAPEDLAIVMDTLATGFLQGPFDIRLNDNAPNIDQCIVPGNCHIMTAGGAEISVVNNDGESSDTWPGTVSTDA